MTCHHTPLSNPSLPRENSSWDFFLESWKFEKTGKSRERERENGNQMKETKFLLRFRCESLLSYQLMQIEQLWAMPICWILSDGWFSKLEISGAVQSTTTKPSLALLWPRVYILRYKRTSKEKKKLFFYFEGRIS